jgi:subtilisin family serine protease
LCKLCGGFSLICHNATFSIKEGFHERTNAPYPTQHSLPGQSSGISGALSSSVCVIAGRGGGIPMMKRALFAGAALVIGATFMQGAVTPALSGQMNVKPKISVKPKTRIRVVRPKVRIKIHPQQLARDKEEKKRKDPTALQANIAEQPAAKTIADQLLVAFPAQVVDQVIDDIAGQYGLTRLSDMVIYPIDLRVVNYGISGGQTLPDLLPVLQADPRLEAAQFNYVYESSASGKNQYALKHLKIAEANKISHGEGVVVAVIDSAIDISHPSLKDTISDSYNALGQDKSSPDSHGTVIAGIIAAHGKVSGVAPGAKILAIRAFARSKKSGLVTSNSFALLKSVNWAVANGARVLNLSFEGPHDPLLERFLKTISTVGIIVVAAVGNAGPEAKPAYPAAYETVIAVTAVDYRKRLYHRAIHGSHVDVAAPGVKILSTKPGGKYGFLTGTSMAAAYVSGIAALMLEQKPDLTTSEFVDLLSRSAIDLGKSGKDPLFGHGLVDAYGTLKGVAAGEPKQKKLSDHRSN